MNETQLRYWYICDEFIIIKNKTKYFNTKSHKHKEKFGVFVTEHEFIKPDID